MDALMAEIALKRKTISSPAPGGGEGGSRPTKYMRRGDIERMKEEEERRVKEEKEREKREEKERMEREMKKKAKVRSSSHSSDTPTAEQEQEQEQHQQRESGETDGSTPTTFNISNEETIRRLRSKGQPIRLFGESDKDRRLRLRALELIEEKDHEKHGGQNDFRKALEDVESRALKEGAGGKKDLNNSGSGAGNGKDGGGAGGREGGKEGKGSEMLDLELVKTDPDRLYPIIYYALKRTLKEWEAFMDERPEEIKRTTQGKLAAATQRQSAEYLKPLFKLLRSRTLPPDVLARIAEIVHHMQKRQYQKANDSYLRLSIGNAPWPIGVTMVGIHERSAREKISADQVAHVLNDEVSRKYIQSLKRLLTFSQTKYPPEDVTQLMG
ncbi:Prp18 domain-containing protein [Abortiporus biennis]|nr:Prp18 domain-containing protein [Abortiporus biennis]